MARTPVVGVSNWQKAVGALGLLVLVSVGGDLYDVVTSDGSGPGAGSHAPPGRSPASTTPASEAPHAPSPFDHGPGGAR